MNNEDLRFAKMMVQHHEAAIDMARVQLKSGEDKDLKNLAENIIAAQSREIDFLKVFLKQNGVTANPSIHSGMRM